MIQEISIKIKSGGLTHTIQLDTDISENLPYDLAEAFAEVIRLTNANPDMVVEQLINEYGLPENVKERSLKYDDCVTWHRADIAPQVDKAVYVKFEDNSKAPWAIGNIISEEDWVSFVGTHGAKEWCYLNEVLKEGYKI